MNSGGTGDCQTPGQGKIGGWGRTDTREKGEETEMKQAEMGVGKEGRPEVQDQGLEKAKKRWGPFQYFDLHFLGTVVCYRTYRGGNLVLSWPSSFHNMKTDEKHIK